MIIRYKNAKIIHEKKIDLGDLWCREGIIIAPKNVADVEIDVHGKWLAPGFIDLQVNGLHGYDFTSNPSSIPLAAKILPKYGVTSFLPTFISTSSKQYQTINSIWPQFSKKTHNSASILGSHFEGPFLSNDKSGAHNPSHLKNIESPIYPFLQDIYGSLEDVKLITLAPEIPQAYDLIKILQELKIITSAGHTHCNSHQFQQAKAMGLTMVTHLFNAMTPFHHRQPGIIGTVLSDPTQFYSIIADGLHVDPITLRMAWKANPKGLILVSDAVSATYSTNSSELFLGDRQLQCLEDRVVIKGTEVLAGSPLLLDKSLKNFIEWTQCSIIEAINTVTLKPAQLLGIEKTKGILEVDADADFVILDEELTIIETFINGIKFNQSD